MGCCQQSSRRNLTSEHPSGYFTITRDHSAPVRQNTPQQSLFYQRITMSPVVSPRVYVQHQPTITKYVAPPSPVRSRVIMSPVTIRKKYQQTMQSPSSVDFQSVKEQLTPPRKLVEINQNITNINTKQSTQVKQETNNQFTEIILPTIASRQIQTDLSRTKVTSSMKENNDKYRMTEITPTSHLKSKEGNITFGMKKALDEGQDYFDQNYETLLQSLQQSKHKILRTTNHLISTIKAGGTMSRDFTFIDLFQQLEQSGYKVDEIEEALSVQQVSSIINSRSSDREVRQLHAKMVKQLHILNTLVGCLEHKLKSQDKNELKMELRKLEDKVKHLEDSKQSMKENSRPIAESKEITDSGPTSKARLMLQESIESMQSVKSNSGNIYLTSKQYNYFPNKSSTAHSLEAQSMSKKLDSLIRKLEDINESYKHMSSSGSKYSEDLEFARERFNKEQFERRERFKTFLRQHNL